MKFEKLDCTYLARKRHKREYRVVFNGGRIIGIQIVSLFCVLSSRRRYFRNDMTTTIQTTTSPKRPLSRERKRRRRREGKEEEDKEEEEPSDFDLFCLVYNFLQSNAYEDAAQKMMREMKRRLKAEHTQNFEASNERDTAAEKKKKTKNKTRTKKLVQMLNALTTTTTTTANEKDDERGGLLPKVKPLRNVMREFLSLKTKERRRTKSTNEPMKMIFRQCEEAFGNAGRDGLSKEKEVEEEEEDDDEDDDGRRGVVGIAEEEEEEEEEDAAAAQPHLIQTRDDTTTTTNTNRERRNKKKQAAPQRKHKQTLYKQSLDDANVREKIADVIVRTLHKKTGRTPNPTPTLNSAKSNKNIEREELAFSDVEDDDDDDGNEFGGVTELELDKIAEMMDKPEDTMETANAILGSLMESTDNDLGRFLEDLVAQTEHGNTKEINKLPTPKKRLLLKEDQKAVNLKETNNGQKTP